MGTYQHISFFVLYFLLSFFFSIVTSLLAYLKYHLDLETAVFFYHGLNDQRRYFKNIH